MGRITTRVWVQLAALAALTAAFSGRPAPVPAAMPECFEENICTFPRQGLIFIVDYSTAMNEPFTNDATRWETAVDLIDLLLTSDNGFLDQNALLGLIRYGHDPDPQVEGTTIPGDSSGLVDGVATDVVWFDPDDDYALKPCDAQATLDSLAATPPPLDGALSGIEPWTNGGLLRSRDLLNLHFTEHPEDVPSENNRNFHQIVFTPGAWTDPDGAGQSPQHDPTLTAADMFQNGVGPGEKTNVATYVVHFGGPDQPETEELADAGGTYVAIDAADQQLLLAAITQIYQDIPPPFPLNCAPGQMRVMILLDASSAMLNAEGGQAPAPEDASGWDQARYALAGDPYNTPAPLFKAAVDYDPPPPYQDWTIEDIAYLGLTVFGDDQPAPGEQRVLVQYGECTRDNIYWALSPQVSHPNCPSYDYSVLDGLPYTPINAIVPAGSCDAPWGGPQIAWQLPSSVDNAPGPLDDPAGPGFDLDTYAHMPRCDDPDQGSGCAGSGAFTHLGLELVRDNQLAYHAQALEGFEVQDGLTPYVNILVTAGRYDGYSTDAEVQAPLAEMLASGIPTYVVGVGDGSQTPEAMAQLEMMAAWGGTDTAHYIDDLSGLEAALKATVEAVPLDPCCWMPDCSLNPEPWGNEPDETPMCLCSEDADCGEGDLCVPVHPELGPSCGVCESQRPDPDPGCSSNDDCDAGLICQGGDCVPDHDSDGGSSDSDDSGTTPTSAGPTSAGPSTGADTSTGDDSDTTSPETTAIDPGGCACASNDDGDPPWWALLAVPLALRRRRRSP